MAINVEKGGNDITPGAESGLSTKEVFKHEHGDVSDDVENAAAVDPSVASEPHEAAVIDYRTLNWW